jgi:hypothetical protein
MPDYSASKTLYEEFLPEELANNILINPADAFASYTYRLTMSMMPYSFYGDGKITLGTEKTNRIIIAQTGVTKFQIDELEINSVVHPSPPANLPGNTTSAYRLNFNLNEPFGMSFIDLLNRTAYELNKTSKIEFPGGKTPPLQTMPYIMEIELLGIPDPQDITEGSGETSEFSLEGTDNVFYKTAIPFRIVNFDINPAVSGTTYNIQAVTINEIGTTASRSVTIVPAAIEISGGTVEELLLSLTTAMQEQQKGLANKKLSDEDAEKFAIEYGEYKLGDEGFPNHKDIFKEGLPIDPEYFGSSLALKDVKKRVNKTTESLKQDAEAGKEDPPAQGNEKTITIKIPAGVSIPELMVDLGSLNSNYILATHRFDTGNEAAELDTNTLNKKKTQIVVPKTRRTWTWPEEKFTAQGKMALTHTYHLTGRLSSTTVMNPKELEIDGFKENTLVKEAAVNRGVVKSYNYFYTGVNDQVYNVDLNINNGVRYLMPGYGGKQSNYSLSQAGAADKVVIQKIDTVKDEQSASVEKEILAKFEAIGTDIKDTLTKLATLPMELTADLAALATGLNPLGAGGLTTKNIRTLNPRLPSSPLSILSKTNTIGILTSSLDELTTSITDLQAEIEGTISEFISGQISEIVSKAFTPFDILDSKLNKIGEGINGFIDQVDSALGDIGLDQFGIDTTSLLDEARDKVGNLSSAIKIEEFTPPGFSSSSVTSNVDNFDSLYAEEFEYNDSEELVEYGQDIGGSIFGEYDMDEFTKQATDKSKAGLPPSKFANRSLFSTMLSNSTLGAPYMVRTTLEIKGDPYWFGKAPITSDEFEYVQGKEFLGDFENDVGKIRKESAEQNTAPYGLGEVCFFFAYLFPREYDTWSDDMSRNTGEMVDLSMDKSFSGQFTPYRVTHILAGGTFRQQLEAYKIVYKGQYPALEDLSVVKAQMDQASADKASEEDAKTLTSNVSQDLSNLLESRLGVQGNPSGIIPGTGVRGTRPSNTTGQTSGYNGPGPGGGGNNPQFDPGA